MWGAGEPDSRQAASEKHGGSLNALLAMAAPALERCAAETIVAPQREDKNNGTIIDNASPL
jgi:hypothetical protein